MKRKEKVRRRDGSLCTQKQSDISLDMCMVRETGMNSLE